MNAYEPCPKCGEYHNNCFQLKDLTDEEIKERFFEFCQSSGTWRDFKRAILRKTQENG